MNKNDLASQVAAETSATRATAERMIGAVFAAIGDALARDEPVAIAGFGTFFTRTRALRRGRNPQTGERLDTPPRRCRYSRPRRSCEIPSAAADETRHRGVRARRSARGTVPVATVPAAATPRLRQARQLAPRWTSPSHPRFPSSIPCRLGSLRIVWGRENHRTPATQPHPRRAVLRPDTMNTTHDKNAASGFEAEIGGLAARTINSFNRLASKCRDAGCSECDDA